MSLAFVFPGQGSQSVGMLSALARISPTVEQTFAEASEVLGYDLWKRCQEGPEEALNATECTQPAMLTAGVATYRLWRERGGAVPGIMAGHSLGEFSALVAAGCVDFKAAVDLVKFRAAGHAGRGAAGRGRDGRHPRARGYGCRSGLHRGCAGRGGRGGQLQCAGTGGDCRNGGRGRTRHRIAKAKGARRALPLAVSVPAHSSLMRPAAERLRARLSEVAVASGTGDLASTAST